MLRPVSRRILIKKFIKLGFAGPVSGGKHCFMKKDSLKVSIPSPHKQDMVDVPLLKEILRQAGISQSNWESR